MKHTAQTLAKFLQNYDNLPVYFTSEYSDFIDKVDESDVSVVWLQKSTKKDEYPNYGDNLQELIEDANTYRGSDEPEVSERDFIQVLLISRG